MESVVSTEQNTGAEQTTELPLITFALVNSETNEIVDLDINSDGAQVDFGQLGIEQYNLVALVNPDNPQASSVESIRFESDLGDRTENVEPYALFGDVSGDFRGRSPESGSFSVTATAFTADGAAGETVASASLTLPVTGSAGGETDPAEPPSTGGTTTLDSFSFGTDEFTGGPGGDDTVDFSQATGGVFTILDSSFLTQPPGQAELGQEGSVRVRGTTPGTSIAGPTETLTDIENIVGSPFDDVFFLNAEDNTIRAGQGDDSISIVDGNNTIDGGDGIDTVNYLTTTGVTVDLNLQGQAQDVGSTTDTLSNIENILGSFGDDTIIGDNEVNNLSGSSGNDTIRGGGGDDRLNGDDGNDTLFGESGSDVFSFSLALPGSTVGNDVVKDFEAGSDKLLFTNVFTDIREVFGAASQAGNDTLIDLGEDGSVLIENTQLDEIINDENIVIRAGETNFGTPIEGTSGDDTLIGTDGTDTFIDSEGIDSYNGGAGTDALNLSFSPTGASVFLDESVNSDVSAEPTQNGQLTPNPLPAGTTDATALEESLTDIEDITGTDFDDFLVGNAEDNIIVAGRGNDLVDGVSGSDILDGGAGIDTLSFLSSPNAVTFDLSRQRGVQDLGPGLDTISNFENVVGSRFDDTLTGDDNDNDIKGGLGNDVIDGGMGSDTLDGGDGDDVLSGGRGEDTFVYRTFGGTLNQGSDVLDGFDAFADMLDFRTTFSTLEEVTAAASQQGNDTLVSLGQSGSVLIQGTNVDELTSQNVLVGELMESAIA